MSIEEVFTSCGMRSIWQPHPLRRLLPCFLLPPPPPAGTATTTATISASTTAIASCAAI